MYAVWRAWCVRVDVARVDRDYVCVYIWLNLKLRNNMTFADHVKQT